MSSRWLCSLDSLSCPLSWEDWRAACIPPSHPFCPSWGGRTGKHGNVRVPSHAALGAVENLVELYHTHTALACSPGLVRVFRAIVLAKEVGGGNGRHAASSGPTQEMRHRLPGLGSPPHLGNSEFL